ncbi:DUF4261 domain-containing protein [Corynebacterium sp.]|uniref:DUF4261 domain-containing protein n=1 Tax=Corynebacterium sp. TaxID=1720 RepID=UPI0026DC1237|nr:DUF4261 domain-containing protein [Corynebacterium sp.]MDO5077070.1 DUF4261 domain-containing protein [Corynebacterium sp.]
MSVAMAMLLQHEADLGVTEDELKNQLAEDWPDLDVSQFIRSESEDGVLAFTFEGYVVMVGLVQRPMRELNHISELCAASRLWPDEVAFDTDYQAHTLVSVAGVGDGNELEAAALLTRVICSLIAIAPHGFAVFWESAQHLAYPGFVREIALQELPRPLPAIWVSYNIGPGPDGNIAALTVGLERLGLMDVEIPEVDEPGRETLELLFSTAGYLMEYGCVIKDGDVITSTDDITIRAVHGPSMLSADKTVLQLHKQPAR